MTSLLLDNNTYITYDKLVMAELVHFYKDLFLIDVDFVESQLDALQCLLYYTHSTLSSHEIKMLEKKPTKSELHKTLLSLAKGKSSGIDGLTLELFKSCWHLIKDPYFVVI